MDGKTQRELATRVKEAFAFAGIEVEEPFNDRGNRIYRPLKDADWCRFVAALARIGYRMTPDDPTREGHVRVIR